MTDIEKTLVIYEGRCDPAKVARVNCYIGVTGWVFGYRLMFQNETSSIAFDFGKYGDMLFLRRGRISRVCF